MDPETFIAESNRIEGIHRAPKKTEIAEFKRFMALKQVTVKDVENFVRVYQPGAFLRGLKGMDVRVGDYYPPKGGTEIVVQLEAILEKMNAETPFGGDVWGRHVAYERLHPFTDCNGRSGRMLWAWEVRTFDLGFLHTFYYQTLRAVQK